MVAERVGGEFLVRWVSARERGSVGLCGRAVAGDRGMAPTTFESWIDAARNRATPVTIAAGLANSGARLLRDFLER